MSDPTLMSTPLRAQHRVLSRCGMRTEPPAGWLTPIRARGSCNRSQMLFSSERPCSPASAYSMSESAQDLPPARRGRRSGPTVR